jgi:hypothetical protein
MRSRRVGFYFAAQVADVDSQNVHLAFIRCPPHLPQQLPMCNHFPRVL